MKKEVKYCSCIKYLFNQKIVTKKRTTSLIQYFKERTSKTAGFECNTNYFFIFQCRK